MALRDGTQGERVCTKADAANGAGSLESLEHGGFTSRDSRDAFRAALGLQRASAMRSMLGMAGHCSFIRLLE